MGKKLLASLIDGVSKGQIVPYLGPGVLMDVRNKQSGEVMPAGNDSLIIAMNGGKPMAAKLMYEFPRAAMNLELKRGRRYIEKFLTKLYGENEWTRGALHDWLADIKPPYVIDVNRDTQLQDSYSGKLHVLVQGIARISGTDFRFILHEHDGQRYRGVGLDELTPGLPILFKPMGSPTPEPTFIASDADYVDYITELMGGFGIPPFLKEYRKGKQYLYLGMRFTRDTERMVMSDIIYDAGMPAGWALIEEPTDKERRYCGKKNIEIIEMGLADFLTVAKVLEVTG